uniref:Potassium channel toxin n=1 Tax=Hemiscorpius lepturus TaxID=520031 RepID=A0A1L4BJ36_HEMLE|nr:potassium channel toxin [Hemiscorpius lepturus]
MNSKAAFLFLLLTVMMLANEVAAQIHTKIPCRYSNQCHDPCRKITGFFSSKCMNGFCTCYR